MNTFAQISFLLEIHFRSNGVYYNTIAKYHFIAFRESLIQKKKDDGILLKVINPNPFGLY